ncbi:MAG: HEAT repeat domain-containing protein, partial [Armatimonadota bacterium]
MSVRRVLWTLPLLAIAVLLLPAVIIRRDMWLQEQVRLLGDDERHGQAAERLVRAGSNAVPELIAALESGNSNVRWRAAEALGQIGDERAIEPLGRAVDGGSLAAEEALGKVGTPPARQRLAQGMYRQARPELDRLHRSWRRSRQPRPWHAEYWYHSGWAASWVWADMAKADRLWPRDPETERALAESELLLGRYERAARAFRRYLAARPHDERAREYLRQAEYEAALLAAAKPCLPEGYLPYKALECSLWSPCGHDLAVLAAKRIAWPKEADLPARELEVEGCRLAGLRPRGSGYELVYLSSPIERSDSLRALWQEIGLWAGDLDSDGDTEVLVGAGTIGASWAPQPCASV